MLMVHCADRHLASTGYVLFISTKDAMESSPKHGTPLEKIAKGTISQSALNLSLNKMREDLVYENSCINTFVCDRLIQPRNQKLYPGKDVRKDWLNMQKVAHMLKYFGTGENRPINGTYWYLVNANKKGTVVMPKYYN